MAGEPREFGPYRLVRRLGVGGMAETFEATRFGAGGFEQRVCLKRVLPAFSNDRQFVELFEREANLAAQLRHTNVVGVVDFGQIDDVHYMTLELVDGVDLRSFLKSMPDETLPAEWVALVAIDLAHALEHAHRTLVHRDISPANVLVSRSGEAKLADFGVAKAIESAGATASRSAKGKVPYMCPERIRGEPIDGRADLFSLGVVLFEAAAGVRPFDGAHDVETMQKILSGNRVSLTDAAPEVPSALREIIDRLVEIEPGRRTASAAALLEELAAVAPPPSARRELAKTIEGFRDGPGARLHVRAREEERDTELSPADAAQTHRGPARPSRSTRWSRVAVAILVLVGAVMGAFWIDRGTDPPAAPESAQLAAPAVDAPAEGPPPAPEDAAPLPLTPTGPAAEPGPQRSSPRSNKGWLHVVVQPWGNVWIDDVWMGRAPVEARVQKGRHVVKVGRELPTKTKVVRVEAGARKEIELSLTE